MVSSSGKTFDELLELDDHRRAHAKHAREGRSNFLALFIYHGTLLPRLITDPLLWTGFMIYFVIRLITATHTIQGKHRGDVPSAITFILFLDA